MCSIRAEDENIKKRILSVLLLLPLLTVYSCVDASAIDQINTLDYFTGQILDIPVSFRYGVPQGSSASTFSANETIEELGRRIEDVTAGEYTYQAEDYGAKNLLVFFTDEKEDRSVALLTKNETAPDVTLKAKYLYRFFNLKARLKFTLSDQEKQLSLFFPYHLVNDSSIEDDFSTLASHQKYQTEYDMTYFVAFYTETIRLYSRAGLTAEDLAVDENSFTVNYKFLKTDQDERYTAAERCVKYDFSDWESTHCFTLSVIEAKG